MLIKLAFILKLYFFKIMIKFYSTKNLFTKLEANSDKKITLILEDVNT